MLEWIAIGILFAGLGIAFLRIAAVEEEHGRLIARHDSVVYDTILWRLMEHGGAIKNLDSRMQQRDLVPSGRRSVRIAVRRGISPEDAPRDAQ
jgi:hypothetical protein